MWPIRFTPKKFFKMVNSTSERTHEKAFSRFYDAEFSEAEEQELVRATTGDFVHEDTPKDILRFLWDCPGEHLIEPLVESFPSLNKHPEARETALRILTEIQTPRSMKALADLLVSESSEDVELDYTFIPIRLENQDEDERSEEEVKSACLAFLDALTPNIERLDKLESRYYLLEFFLKLARGKLFSPDSHPAIVDWNVKRAFSILNNDIPDYRKFCEWCSKDKSDEEEWPLSEERVQEVVFAEEELGLVFHLLRYLPDQNQVNLFKQALDIECPSAQLYAVVALANLGIDQEEHIHEICQNKGSREILWTQFKSIDRLDLYPKELFNQASLAEAEMIGWIAHPMELNRQPSSIELCDERVVNDIEYGKCKCYFFRFQGDKEDEYWMIGMAGPYPIDGPPKIGGRWTFSQFKEYDENGDNEESIEWLISRYYEPAED